MPRNIVTLVPRRLVLPTKSNRTSRERVRSAVLERFRGRLEQDPERIELDFPKSVGRRAAKDEVIKALDEIDRRWRRVFALYPRDSAIREPGE